MPSPVGILANQQPLQLPAIPTPVKGNEDNAHDTLMAIKQAVEQLMGTVGAHPVTRTFVQEQIPRAYVIGDQWVQPSKGHVSYWDGVAWRLTRGA